MTRHDAVRSKDLQQRLHALVPGGAHTYARGSDQYPEDIAPILVRGEGARVWDVDGREFVEYGMGLRSVTLGHGYAPIVDAVSAELAIGVNFTRPTELELIAAETFVHLVTGAEMVKFAKNGSDVTTAALRLARAFTGRRKVAVCRQHFFSSDDWFISGTAMSAGTDPVAGALTVRFDFNSAASLEQALLGRDVACVFMEPATAESEPAPGFLDDVRALCDRYGTLLVLDEMITGFRWSPHGAEHIYGVTPDLSCWGKAMGNGFAVAALAGRREVMELGGLNTDAERVFLLSSTNGAESVGLAAFRAVAEVYRQEGPIERMEAAGRRLSVGVEKAVAEAGVAPFVSLQGRSSCLVYKTLDLQGRPSQAYRTLFMQELITHGVLGTSFITSAAHTDADIDLTIDAVAEACVVYRAALDAGSVEGFLHGRPGAPALRSTAAPRRLL